MARSAFFALTLGLMISVPGWAETPAETPAPTKATSQAPSPAPSLETVIGLLYEKHKERAASLCADISVCQDEAQTAESEISLGRFSCLYTKSNRRTKDRQPGIDGTPCARFMSNLQVTSLSDNLVASGPLKIPNKDCALPAQKWCSGAARAENSATISKEAVTCLLGIVNDPANENRSTPHPLLATSCGQKLRNLTATARDQADDQADLDGQVEAPAQARREKSQRGHAAQ
jgi:hypothetical protein